jgi:hypothetical protein
VTVATFPFVIKYFGAFPVFGLIANLVFVPVLSFSFQVAVFAVVTWVGKFLMPPIHYLVEFVRLGTQAIASIPFAQIRASNDGYWFLAYFLALILCSRFIFLKPVYKYSAAGVLFVIYLIGFFV